MSEVKEMDINGEKFDKLVSRMKEGFSELLKSNDIKLVGLSFYFLVNDKILVTSELWCEGFETEKFGIHKGRVGNDVD